MTDPKPILLKVDDRGVLTFDTIQEIIDGGILNRGIAIAEAQHKVDITQGEDAYYQEFDDLQEKNLFENYVKMEYQDRQKLLSYCLFLVDSQRKEKGVTQPK